MYYHMMIDICRRINKVIHMSTRRQRILSHRAPTNLSKSGHIVEDNLQRNSRIAQKYKTNVLDEIDRIDTTLVRPKRSQQYIATQRKQTNNRQRLLSGNQGSYQASQSKTNMNDYQKLLLGLQYSLQNQRQKRQSLQNKNQSLETQISNLRNLLVGPRDQHQYEMAAFKQYQQKISGLENKIIQQKKNYQFIIDSKNEALASLQFQLRTIQKKIKDEQQGSVAGRKLLQLMSQIQQFRETIMKKNITIQKLRFHKMQQNDSQSDEDDIKEIARRNKIQFYGQQLEISNKLILRKNIQILNLNKKTLKFEEVLDVIEQYLDKKQVKNVDLNILEHACVNKLRVLLRQKAVFQRQMLTQLNQHNKKISVFEKEVVERDHANGGKVLQLMNDNKRLSSLVGTLQNNIKNLQKTLEEGRRQQDILKNQIDINKAKFIQDIKIMKDELNTISSVTKGQFDRMKIQNLKLSQQNRSLLFLVGQKQKQLHKNGQAIRSFQDYKDKINNLNVSGPERRKIDNVAQNNPQIGTKILLIDNFSNWMMEWNKIKNWNNKKVLLNLILDKEEIRADSLNSLNYLVNVLHEAILSSKNAQIQERAVILLSYYLPHQILKNPNLFINKVAPIVIRGLRPMIQGQDTDRHRLLNQASVKILSAMERNSIKWSQDMTNQMLSVNGLKCLFGLIANSQIDQLVQHAYNCLILIAKSNEMISFMNSFNVSGMLLNNLTKDYPFIVYALHLLKELLNSKDFLKSQKSLLDFRQIHQLFKDQEEQIVDITLDCALILMGNVLYTKSINKIETASFLTQALKNIQNYQILKKVGEVYSIILTQLQTQNVSKLLRQVDKLTTIVNAKKFTQNKFHRSIRIFLHMAQQITQSKDLDDKIMVGVSQLYESYQAIETKTRVKMNSVVSTIYERNKQVINKYSNQRWIQNLVQAYKCTNINQQLTFLLKILLFQNQQKRTTQILRSGRQSFLNKLISDSLIPDYSVALPALKNLIPIAKQKYAQKFMTKDFYAKIIQKVLKARMEEQYLGIAVSILYFFSKNQQGCEMVIDAGVVQKVLALIVQKHDKEQLVYRCLTLLQLCHSTNYKKKILNYLLSSDPNLHILKTINLALKKAKNKKDMGTRAVFLYDFLNGKTSYQSLALLIQDNNWMVGDIVQVRNAYVNQVDPLVYKIELLLHNMSNSSSKVRKIYEKFKVQGEYESQDDR